MWPSPSIEEKDVVTKARWKDFSSVRVSVFARVKDNTTSSYRAYWESRIPTCMEYISNCVYQYKKCAILKKSHYTIGTSLTVKSTETRLQKTLKM